MRFNKIKIMSDDSIKLEYEDLNENAGFDEFSMKSAEEPDPDFERALDGLIPHIEEICEMPKKDHHIHPYTVKGVSFSYGGEDDTMGITMTATRTLTESNSPLVLNTPHMIEKPYAEGSDDTQVMGSNLMIDLQAVIKEARAYLNGKRAQKDMFQEA